ncbi:hypothetical protein AWV79_12450 [Cupriavidus sp. UYMMa02A]|nr:hypothetical protein AWV79_12450 [Cupriavidus sp. UYMMa02A]
MAVDFSLLPPEEPIIGMPPSKLVWGIVFVVTVLLGVAAVLLLWPRGVPTHTWKFWTSLVIFPVGISGFVVLRRFSRYEAPVLDVGLHNAAVRAFNERVFRAASIPLALVGPVHRFSARPDENAAASIQKGILTLKTRASIARDEEPVRARWLNTPGMQTTPGNLSDDLDRSRQVTAWLLDELVTELLPRIRKLPLGMPLRVRLQITNGLPPEENTQLWETCCRTKPLRGVVVVQGAERLGD